MENSNIYIHPDVEKTMYPKLDSLPQIPNQVSRLNYPTHAKSSASSISYNSNSPSISKSSNSTIKRMIILDWDDTLFPTTQWCNNPKSMSIEDLHNWGEKIYELLVKYIEVFGANSIFIITNAIDGWIQYALQCASQRFNHLSNWRSLLKPKLINYFTKIEDLLISKKIKTISARALYEHEYPTDHKMWKLYTFIDYAWHHFCHANKGIIVSIGDSFDEWIASKVCQQYITNLDQSTLINLDLQRIKLKNAPTLDELMQQWETLILIADHLRLKNKSLDQSDLYSVSLTLKSELDKKMKDNAKSKSNVTISKMYEKRRRNPRKSTVYLNNNI